MTKLLWKFYQLKVFRICYIVLLKKSRQTRNLPSYLAFCRGPKQKLNKFIFTNKTSKIELCLITKPYDLCDHTRYRKAIPAFTWLKSSTGHEFFYLSSTACLGWLTRRCFLLLTVLLSIFLLLLQTFILVDFSLLTVLLCVIVDR